MNQKNTSHPERLVSLDVLRGFDMLWITGGAVLITRLSDLSGAGWLKALANQMDHVSWEGFRFYDLIFPLFMFISGIAIPLSLRAKLSRNIPRKKLAWTAFKRMIILIVLGLLYNGVFKKGFHDARYLSILGQIGIAYFFAFLIVLYSKSLKMPAFWLFGILAGVSVIQLLIPVPGIGAGVLTPEGCINGYIDRLLVPGRLAYDAHAEMTPGQGIFDALGLLCIVSAIGITLMGTMTGQLILHQKKYNDYHKTGIMIASGVVLILISLLLSPYYPVIKKCWTTTYNLMAGGISLLLFAVFYLIIDVWKIRKWGFFFRVIGLNSIFIYLFSVIVPMGNITDSFLGWLTVPAGEAGALVKAAGVVAGEWLLLYFMYRKNIFVKV
jgi:predicted acyltransferase